MGAVTITGDVCVFLDSVTIKKCGGRPLRPSLRFGREPHDASCGRVRTVFAPPPVDDFDYCEIGTGRGDTIATLAGAYPKARFVGVDINPEHVAFASGLAEKAGL